MWHVSRDSSECEIWCEMCEKCARATATRKKTRLQKYSVSTRDLNRGARFLPRPRQLDARALLLCERAGTANLRHGMCERPFQDGVLLNAAPYCAAGTRKMKRRCALARCDAAELREPLVGAHAGVTHMVLVGELGHPSDSSRVVGPNVAPRQRRRCDSHCRGATHEAGVIL